MHMKILLCFSSQLRNSDVSFRSIRKNLIEKNAGIKPDLVAYLDEASESQKDHFNILKPVIGRSWIKFEPDPVFSREILSRDTFMSPLQHRNGLKGNLLQWHSLKQCAAMVQERLDEGMHYDAVIWMRPDLLVYSPFKLRFPPPGKVLVPFFDNHGGVNDRFCIAGPHDMIQRMKILDFFLENYACRRFPPGEFWHPEGVLEDSLKKLNLQVEKAIVPLGKIRSFKEGIFVSVPYHASLEIVYRWLGATELERENLSFFPYSARLELYGKLFCFLAGVLQFYGRKSGGIIGTLFRFLKKFRKGLSSAHKG